MANSMKLEVGQFIRFKDKRGNTYIRSIKEVCNEQPHKSWGAIIIDKNANNVPYVSLKNIIKASYNIIDILEVGDVIIDKEGHKYPINYEFETDYNGEYKSYEITIDDHITLFLKDGLSIVTHEQMKQMEYKVEE